MEWQNVLCTFIGIKFCLFHYFCFNFLTAKFGLFFRSLTLFFEEINHISLVPQAHLFDYFLVVVASKSILGSFKSGEKVGENNLQPRRLGNLRTHIRF